MTECQSCGKPMDTYFSLLCHECRERARIIELTGDDPVEKERIERHGKHMAAYTDADLTNL